MELSGLNCYKFMHTAHRNEDLALRVCACVVWVQSESLYFGVERGSRQCILVAGIYVHVCVIDSGRRQN